MTGSAGTRPSSGMRNTSGNSRWIARTSDAPSDAMNRPRSSISQLTILHVRAGTGDTIQLAIAKKRTFLIFIR